MKKPTLRIEFSGLALVETSATAGRCVLSAGSAAAHSPCLYLPAETIDQRFTPAEIATFGLDVIPLPTGLFLIECRLAGAKVAFFDDQGNPLKGKVAAKGAEAKYKKQARKVGASPTWSRLAYAIDLADIVATGSNTALNPGLSDGEIALPSGTLSPAKPTLTRDQKRMYKFLRGGAELFKQRLASVLELTARLPGHVLGVTLNKGAQTLSVTMSLPDGDTRILASSQCACAVHAKDELKEFNASLAQGSINVELDYSDKATIPHGICPSAYRLG